jgi:hypothetical protein
MAEVEDIGLEVGDTVAILGGKLNNTCCKNDAFIIGSNICAVSNCTLHANCLNLKNIPSSPTGLPAGSVYKDASGFLKIV